MQHTLSVVLTLDLVGSSDRSFCSGGKPRDVHVNRRRLILCRELLLKITFIRACIRYGMIGSHPSVLINSRLPYRFLRRMRTLSLIHGCPRLRTK
jgi:hypothetical protein